MKTTKRPNPTAKRPAKKAAPKKKAVPQKKAAEPEKTEIPETKEPEQKTEQKATLTMTKEDVQQLFDRAHERAENFVKEMEQRKPNTRENAASQIMQILSRFNDDDKNEIIRRVVIDTKKERNDRGETLRKKAAEVSQYAQRFYDGADKNFSANNSLNDLLRNL